ncbi:transposable element Tc3 transposase [Trichonephila clavipes]|nr:transposable element Tc3 transposase [Trichonephila clavipes]
MNARNSSNDLAGGKIFRVHISPIVEDGRLPKKSLGPISWVIKFLLGTPKSRNFHDVQELWFQQDGAKCHTARAAIDLLKDTFGDRLISRFGPVIWPPRSCDLTPLDYFLWRYVKSLVYADKPQTLHHLEDNMCRVIADIRPQMLEKVIENWTSRLDYIRASRGSPMSGSYSKCNATRLSFE